ncbi:peroxiredoxin [Achromatium sp. WMS2]|nr:peroxiredoxin [Achromatium sp. WMS2]
MQARVKWLDGVAMVGETSSGHAVVMDGAQEHGGRNIGPRPMEMLLLGMGGCSQFDVLHILRKSRQKVTACELHLEAQRASEDPKVFTHIHMHFTLTGKNLDPKKVTAAIGLSADKYCSASIMLGMTALITHDFTVIEG